MLAQHDRHKMCLILLFCRVVISIILLIDDFLSIIIQNLKNEKKLKLSKFGTFTIRSKKSRMGRNPKTKEQKIISDRDVVLFKASKEFKDLVNSKNDS